MGYIDIKWEKPKKKRQKIRQNQAIRINSEIRYLKSSREEPEEKEKRRNGQKPNQKVNNAVFWTKPVWDKLLRDVVAKETYITPSIISEKLKLNVSLAREAIRQLLSDNQIAPHNGEYSFRMCNFVKTDKFVAPVAEKKRKRKKEINTYISLITYLLNCLLNDRY